MHFENIHTTIQVMDSYIVSNFKQIFSFFFSSFGNIFITHFLEEIMPSFDCNLMLFYVFHYRDFGCKAIFKCNCKQKSVNTEII